MKKLKSVAKSSKAELFSKFPRSCRPIFFHPGRWCALALAGFTLLNLSSARAVDYHVATAQDLQTALTLAAASSVSNNIYVTNGYYTGNFNYKSSNVNSLTILAEANVPSSQIVIDSGGTGSSMNISAIASPNITVQGITFLRNCGSSTLFGNGWNLPVGGLQIAGGATTILVNGCSFLSPANSSGTGLFVTSGINATVTNCTAIGISTAYSGSGIFISVTGNLTVQNCSITGNGGGLCALGNVVAISGCVINDNLAGAGGGTAGFGGVLCAAYTSPYSYASVPYASSVTLSGNILTGNSGSDWDGPAGGGATCISFATILTNNIFNGNSCQDNSYVGGGGGAGGGAFCGGGNDTISGNTFIGNWVSNVEYEGYNDGDGLGGGVYCDGNLTLSDNIFTDNSATGFGRGGGVWCSAATITGNTFTGNSAVDGQGGGAYCANTATLSNNTFTYNSSANGQGGGAYCAGTATLTNNTFTGNSSANGQGGGAYCSGTATISGNNFGGNSSASGGGFYASGPIINLLDNLVINNVANSSPYQGGGIWVDASATLNMVNNTVTANTAGYGGGAAYVATGTVELLNVYNNIIWGNSATVNGGDVWLSGTGQQKVFEFNDVDSMSGVWDIAVTNIDLAPQFFDPVNGDYHTQTNSPCIAVGTTNAPSLPATDLDGNPRIINGLVDLGCYEFTTAVTHPADTNASFVITPAEFKAYAWAWKHGRAWTNGPYPGPNPITANYVTRAGYLMTNGGAYYNDGSARPVNWKIAP